MAHAALDNLDAAIRDYDEAIRLNPRFALAFLSRSIAYERRGDLDAAIRDYGEAIRLDPRNATAFYNRGVVYEWRGNLGQAAADFREAARLGHKEARLSLARVEAALAAQERPLRGSPR